MAISSDLFTGVDLSRLPAPEVVRQLAFEEIRDTILADVAAFIPSFNALTPADPVWKLVEYFAYREMLLRADSNDQAQGVMLALASGSDLDQLGALYGVERFVIAAAKPDRGIEAELESDADYRARIVRAPEAFTVAGSTGAYLALAKNADSRVRHASCVSPGPGLVIVTVLAREGDGSASADLVTVVAKYLSDENRRPLTDNLTVQSAEIVPFAVDANIRTYSGPDAALVIETARAKLQDWFSQNLLLGRDITEDAIHAELRVEGVSRVSLIGWNDVICDGSQAGHCTGITLNHEGHGG